MKKLLLIIVILCWSPGCYDDQIARAPIPTPIPEEVTGPEDPVDPKTGFFVDPATPEGTLPMNPNVGTAWYLDFSDEFEGSEVNTNKWTVDNSSKTRTPRPDIGVSQWFWRPANVGLSDGKLVLKVKKENENTMHNGSINSRDKYEVKYGYFEARIQVGDVNKGTHTAFWMQGQNQSNVDGTANDGAEIDIFESAWTAERTASVIHIDGYGSSHQANTKEYQTPGIHSGYHIWGFHWTENFMKIYYDGELKVNYESQKWIVHAEEFLWLSNGASFGVSGDKFFVNQSVGWLTESYVDYIRVWKPIGSDPTQPTEPTDPTDPTEPEPTGENLVKNGTFDLSENIIWTKSNSDIAHNDTSNPADQIDGPTCRFPGLAGARNISQTIDITPGTYRFSFVGRIQNAIGPSGTHSNNHASNGPASLTGEVSSSGNVLFTLTTQSNSDEHKSGTFTVPEGVTAVTVKISKNWNIAYVDNVEVVEITN